MRFIKWHLKTPHAAIIHLGSLLLLVILWTVAVDDYSRLDFRYACYWFIPINVFLVVGDYIYFKRAGL